MLKEAMGRTDERHAIARQLAVQKINSIYLLSEVCGKLKVGHRFNGNYLGLEITWWYAMFVVVNVRRLKI